MTYRIAELIDSGINPASIMAVSFTKKAANELKNRVIEVIGRDAIGLRCSTLHSVCLSILRELNPIKSFKVIDDRESTNILTNIATRYEVAIPGSDILIDISKLKAWMVSPEEAISRSRSNFERTLGQIYYEYEYYLKKNGLIDFDNIIIELIKACKHPECQERVGKMFSHVLVDEYQDINYMQGRAINLFLREHDNIAVVGDDAQAIYSFRGANLREILDFENRYHGTKKIIMDLNYRSTSTIVNASSAVIDRNLIGFKKDLKSASGRKGEPIYIAKRYSPEDEARFIASIINYLEGETAILVRVGWLIQPIEEALKEKGISYEVLKDKSRLLESDSDKHSEKVTISTIHASKGLEFDNVIIAGVEEGIIPHYLSLDGYGNIEEERRLFYVALTRAKKQVVITYCCNRKRWSSPSRFIAEIPKKYKEEL